MRHARIRQRRYARRGPAADRGCAAPSELECHAERVRARPAAARDAGRARCGRALPRRPRSAWSPAPLGGTRLPAVLRGLRIENFKAWRDTERVKLAPLTVLFGANSSGKSSINHLLMMLKQTARSPDINSVFDFGDVNAAVRLGQLSRGRLQSEPQPGTQLPDCVGSARRAVDPRCSIGTAVLGRQPGIHSRREATQGATRRAV